MHKIYKINNPQMNMKKRIGLVPILFLFLIIITFVSYVSALEQCNPKRMETKDGVSYYPPYDNARCKGNIIQSCNLNTEDRKYYWTDFKNCEEQGMVCIEGKDVVDFHGGGKKVWYRRYKSDDGFLNPWNFEENNEKKRACEYYLEYNCVQRSNRFGSWWEWDKSSVIYETQEFEQCQTSDGKETGEFVDMAVHKPDYSIIELDSECRNSYWPPLWSIQVDRFIGDREVQLVRCINPDKCNDNIDNDGDSLVDCDDEDCKESEVCKDRRRGEGEEEEGEREEGIWEEGLTDADAGESEEKEGNETEDKCPESCGKCGYCNEETDWKCLPTELEDPCQQCICDESECEIIDKAEFASCKMPDDKEGEETGVCITEKILSGLLGEKKVCIRTCKGACDKYSGEIGFTYQGKKIEELQEEDIISENIIWTCEFTDKREDDNEKATRWREEFEALPLEKQKLALEEADNSLRLIYGSLWWEIEDFINDDKKNGDDFCDEKHGDKKYECLCYSKFLCQDEDKDNFGIEDTNWVNCPEIGPDCWDFPEQNKEYERNANNIEHFKEEFGGVFFNPETLGAILTTVDMIKTPKPEITNLGVEESENSPYRSFCINKLPYGWQKGEKIDLDMSIGPCRDSIDNDCDGKIDCEDDGCFNSVFCKCGERDYEGSIEVEFDGVKNVFILGNYLPENPDAKITLELDLNNVEYKKEDELCGYPKSLDFTIKIEGYYYDFILRNPNVFEGIRDKIEPFFPYELLNKFKKQPAIYSTEEIIDEVDKLDDTMWISEGLKIHLEIDVSEKNDQTWYILYATSKDAVNIYQDGKIIAKLTPISRGEKLEEGFFACGVYQEMIKKIISDFLNAKNKEEFNKPFIHDETGAEFTPSPSFKTNDIELFMKNLEHCCD